MGVSPRTTPSDGVEASQLTAIIEHLTQPVFLFAPVFDGERVVDLTLVWMNSVAAESTRLLCVGRGAVESGAFVDPTLALKAASAAWSGTAAPYLVDRSGVLDGEYHVHEVWTRRVGELIVQVSLDRTSEHAAAAASAEFRTVVDMIAQPLHVHAPVFDDSGRIVDTTILFANRMAETLDPDALPHVGRRSSEVFAEGVNPIDLYQSAWSNPDGAMESVTFDNLDGHAISRPPMYLEIQARRMGDKILSVGLDRTELERSHRELVTTTEQLTNMLDSISDGVAIFDPSGTVLAANRPAALMAGVSNVDDLVGGTLEELGLQYSTSIGGTRAPLRLADMLKAHGMVGPVLAELELADGTVRRHLLTARPYRTSDGRQAGLLTGADVTFRLEALEAMSAAAEEFHSAVDAIADPVLLLEGVHDQTMVVYANAAATMLGPGLVGGRLGVRLEELGLAEEVAASLRSGAQFSAGVAAAGVDGASFDVAVSSAGARRVAVFRNVSRLRAEASLLERLANHDVRSGLPNRRGLDLYLSKQLAELGTGCRSITVAVFEVDQIEAVQRSYGFQVADRVLADVQQRLQSSIQWGATGWERQPFLAQLTGTSFVVVVDDVDRASATELAEHVVASIARPVIVDGMGLHVEVASGLAFAPLHGTDANILVMRAKSAAWTARRRRALVFVWQPEVDQDRVDRVELLAQMDKALSNNELFVEYQPQINLVTGRVIGAEALVRWNHPTIGRLPPSSFVAEVEESALALRFTAWVLRRALEEWMQASPPAGTRLAVNLPPALAGDPGLIPLVEEALIATGADPSMLELEITERGLLALGPVVVSNLSALHSLGVNFTIDDFGTGQASLLYLRRLPVQGVKIDRTFMLHLERDRVNRAIVSACVGVAASLDVSVVAEGLETPDEMSAALELGCGFGQGFHIARPMAMQDLVAFIERNEIPT